MSQHPQHLVENQLVPNAFIPFCSFSGEMNITGKTITGLDIPVCNGFQEDTIDGRLCYTIHVNKLASSERIKMLSGKGKGLVLAIDKGFSIEAYDHRMPDEDESLQHLLDTEDLVKEDSVSVYIATPHRFTARKQGRYMMTDLKKMSGTRSFFNLADKTKGCQIDTEGECKKKKYRMELYNKCGCLPWALKRENEVSKVRYFNMARAGTCL